MAIGRFPTFRLGAIGARVAMALFVAGCGSSGRSISPSATPAANTTPPANLAGGTSTDITLKTAQSSAGMYLAGPSGRALYLWVADGAGKANCSADCARAWPPVLVSSKPRAAAGVNASDLGTTARSDGAKQVTYKGHPLYYFVGDTTAGTTKGQGSDSFGARWWLVAPSGAAITATGTKAAATSTSGSGVGANGY